MSFFSSMSMNHNLRFIHKIKWTRKNKAKFSNILNQVFGVRCLNEYGSNMIRTKFDMNGKFGLVIKAIDAWEKRTKLKYRIMHANVESPFLWIKKKYQIPKSKWNDIKLHYVVENVWSCQNMLYTENGSASGEQATQKIPKYSATD